MNVVLLSSARRMSGEAAVSAREQLGLADRPDVVPTLVTVHRPGQGLPGVDTLVIRSGATGRGRALSVPAGPLTTTDPVEAASLGAADASAITSTGPAGTPSAPAQRQGAARVVHAVRWRSRRAKRALAAHPTARRVARSTKVRRVRSAVAPLGSAGGYAVAAMASAQVQSLVARADVVVALDADTYRAAWLLARRHPGPAVVVGLAAGKQAVAALAD